MIMCLGFGIPALPGQIPEDPPLEFLEDLPEDLLDQIQYQEDLLESLEHLSRHPLDINQVSFDELQQLPFLSPIETEAIIDYRTQYGPLIDIHELQVIEGLSQESIQAVLPFLTVNPMGSAGQTFSSGSGYVLFRTTGHFPLRQGFLSREDRPAAYQGGPLSLLFRFRKSRFGDYSYGINMKKDAGEEFTWKNRAGFDSYHLHYFKTNRPGRLKTLALGDYRISLGQGLLQYHGFAVTKSANPLMIKRVSPVIQPFSGTSEYFFFRGAAAEFEWNKKLRSFIFIHHTNRDATLRDLPDETGQYFSAFQTSGYHRTESEIEKRKNLPETISGHRLEWNETRYKIGINSLYQQYGLPYIPQQRLDNIHRLTGSRFISHSLDFSSHMKSLHVFGEIATQGYKEPAFTVTGLYSFHPKLDGGILIRRFPAYFAPMYGNPFSAGSVPNNESGLYLGFNYFINSRSQFSFYLDSWKGLWPTFQATGPSFDQDMMLRYEVAERKKWQGYAQLKFKHRAENVRQNFPAVNQVAYRNQINLRLQFRKEKYQYWRWTNRAEWIRLYSAEGHTENGILLFSDFHVSPLSSPWTAALRVARFQTDSYASRVYAFESDILYSFSIPAFYGKGWRVALKAGRKWRNGIRAEIRTGWTYRPGEEETGSGNNAVSGPLSQEAKLQMMYTF